MSLASLTPSQLILARIVYPNLARAINAELKRRQYGKAA
jgi:hypothetical protein